MSFKLNPIYGADSYKYGHINFYPEGVTEVYSNFTPRSVKHLNVPTEYKSNTIVWFGGQATIQEMIDWWDENFFNLKTEAELEAAGKVSYIHGFPHYHENTFEESVADFSRVIAPFAGGEYNVDHFRALHKLGYLPLEIKTLPEGSLVPVGIPVMTVRNTLPEFYWLTNFIESYLSTELWKMSTSATIAWYYRKIIENWAEKTGCLYVEVDE